MTNGAFGQHSLGVAHVGAEDPVRAALARIPPDDREIWLCMGMAIKSEFGEGGYSMWDEWSQADTSYHMQDAKTVWRSISPEGGITIGTLFHEARERGWQGTPSSSGQAIQRWLSPNRTRGQFVDDDAKRAKRQRQAAAQALELWKASVAASVEHSYLKKKGVMPHGVRVYAGELKINGVSCDGALILPVRSGGELHSLAFITAEGDKRYLPGGRISGCYFSIMGSKDVILIAEGYATAASCHEVTGNSAAVAFSASNLEKVAQVLRARYPSARLIVVADNDAESMRNTGLEAACNAAAAVNGMVAVPVLDGRKADFNDLRNARGDRAVQEAIDSAAPPLPGARPPTSASRSPDTDLASTSAGFNTTSAIPTTSANWPDPTPLPDGLPPVAPFEYELLPDVLHGRVADIAERMQCPPDFPAVALVVTLASLVGRRCGIAPKRADDWTVVPNLWGMVIGRPGIMKSPPLTEMMLPLQDLQARAIEHFEQAQANHQAGMMVAGEAERIAKGAILKMLKQGMAAAASERAQEAVNAEREEPACRRYVVNDSTVEKLGEILNQNPHGLLIFRDELSGFFRTLDRQGHEADRAFYLECWNGDGSFTYDRIGRGTLHIAGACLSILGSIQPGPLSDLVRGLRGSGDDGLLQRFQLAVWPDASREWRNIDRAPNREARDAVQAVIERLDHMTAESLGADPGRIPLLRFSDDAQALFDRWRESLEIRLRSDTEHPMLEAHLAKYRSLVPTLALVIHLAEGVDGPVTILALERAIAWAEYLESHARRIYAPAISPDLDAARALAKRVKAGDVGASFGLRDIYNRGWSGLATRDEVAAAVGVLADYDWLRSFEETTPGRTRTVYRVNPAVLPTERTA